MTPDADAYRALARSAPWRWRSIHFRHRAPRLEVGAWLERPDGVRIRRLDGTPIELEPGVDHQDTTGPWSPPEPTYRPDGLVARRPDEWLQPDRGRPWTTGREDPRMSDGIFWQNYHWVAMVDPFELSHDVEVDDVEATEVSGRPAWRARLTPLPGYQPLCGGNCCELLYSEAALRAELPDAPAQTDYPDAFDVTLDVGTGIVVRCRPIGGDPAENWFETDIVDAE